MIFPGEGVSMQMTFFFRNRPGQTKYPCPPIFRVHFLELTMENISKQSGQAVSNLVCLEMPSGGNERFIP